MSGLSRKRESLAPSLFPFLAVLLCTMGSLVLILMLIVSAAQADAEHITQEVQQRKEELVSLAEHAVDSYRKKLELGRLDLEKKRLELQHFEEHILELTTELQKLKDRLAKIESDELPESSIEKQREEISDLEKQLAEAEEELKELEEKPKNEKPIFAVIPYRGPNGTHRRPIYLECTSQGVRIQPEGNLVALKDLEPPHGPGNPLDAALRSIRAEYKPANGAITHTAYPLLLVRPNGIRTYVLARAAMSSWDDQFGYELIDGELELAFPDGKTGLSDKIETALALARQRQTALARAMPRRYQTNLDDLTPLMGGGGSPGGRYGGSASSGFEPPQQSSNQSLGSVDRLAAGDGLGYGGSSAGGNNASAGVPQNGTLADSPRGMQNSRPWSSETGSPGYGGQAISGTADSRSSQLPANASNLESAQSSSNMASAYGDSVSATGGAVGDPGGYAAPGESQPPGGRSQVASGSSSRTNGAGGQPMDSAPANASTNQLMSETNSSRSGGGSDSQAGGSASGEGSSTTAAQSGQSYPGQSSSMAMAASPGGAASSQEASESMNQPGIPQLSLNVDMSKQQEQSNPVAARRGRNWAWSDGPRTQTPIVRSLHLHCFDDRWVLLPDSGKTEQAVVIPFDGTPEQRAEKLAKAIRRRVDEWGFALAGGYWKPELVVDVAPEASWRFRQLTRLFEGSGLQIRQRERSALQDGRRSSR